MNLELGRKGKSRVFQAHDGAEQYKTDGGQKFHAEVRGSALHFKQGAQEEGKRRLQSEAKQCKSACEALHSLDLELQAKDFPNALHQDTYNR